MKPFVFIVCLAPLVGGLLFGVYGDLGPDPGKTLVDMTGEWALYFLLLTLSVTPLRQYFGWNQPVRYRRMLGLYCFFYACIHLLAVGTYLLGWSVTIFVEEFAERPYMAAGILAWLLLLPLVVTSTNGMMKQLGARWKLLHKLVYIIGMLVCVHVLWQVKADLDEALIYCAVFMLLMAMRVQPLKKAVLRYAVRWSR